MITAVTAFVPIPGHPRSEEEYHRLAEPLLNMSSQIPLLVAEGSLEQCWLWHWLMERPHGFTWSEADNPQKNSLAYHCVQAEKTEFLEAALTIDPTADIFVWLDYGIMHVPGMSGRIIREFLDRADGERTIVIPGCHEKGEFNYDDEWPNWRCCGGLLAVPREYVRLFNLAVKQEYIRCLEITNNVPWEVNIWSRVEHLHPELPIWVYRANHDASMFTNFKRTEDADGQSATTSQISARVLQL